MQDHPPRRLPVWLIYAITATGVSANTLVVAATPDILDGLDAARSLAGVLVAAPTVPGIALAPVIGLLADRFGRREVLVPCLLIFGLSGAAGAVAPSFWALVVLRLAQGVGAAGLINLAVVLIGDHWEGSERSRVMGRNAAVLTVFIVIFPLVGGVMADVWGWRAPFVAFGAALLTAAAVGRVIPRATSRGAGLREQLAAVSPVLRDPAMVGTLVAGVLVFVVLFGSILTILPLYTEERFALSATARGLLVGLPSVTSTVGSLWLAQFHARFGQRRLVLGSAWILTASLGAMALSGDLLALSAALLLLGLGQGLLIPAMQDEVTAAAPTNLRGTVVAVWVTAVRTGQTIGPLAASAGLGLVGAQTSLALGMPVCVVMVGVLWASSRRATPGVTGTAQ